MTMGLRYDGPSLYKKTGSVIPSSCCAAAATRRMISTLFLLQLAASSTAFVGHYCTGAARLVSQRRGESGAHSRERCRRHHPPSPANPGDADCRGSLGVRTAARLRATGGGAIDGESALHQHLAAGGSCVGASVAGGGGGEGAAAADPGEGAPTAVPAVPPVVGDIRRFSVDGVRVQPGPDAGDESADVPRGNFVDLFRGSAPYIRAHQGTTMVVHMGGDVLEDPNFLSLMDDLGLLSLLGVRLVIVTGAEPQISLLLRQAGIKEEFRDGLRVTSQEALKAIKAAAGFVRIEVESALSRGGRENGSHSIHVSGGNFFSAQPVGVRNGLDYGCTGKVRSVNVDKIRAQLSDGGVLQLNCMGYSASGEVFNVETRDLAAKCAAALGASKLIYVTDGAQLEDMMTGEIINSLRLSEAKSLLSRYARRKTKNMSSSVAAEDDPSVPKNNASVGVATTEVTGARHRGLEEGFMELLSRAVNSLTQGVSRAHVVPLSSGALLEELYTRDGAGLLVSRDIYDGIRLANPRDIPGIMQIIAPLEEKGVLVPRPPEQLEAQIVGNEFFVITRDEAILGVAFFKRYGQDHAEIGCLAVHDDYRKRGWGEAMLSYLERVALASSVKHLFVFSTTTMQWFVERGFTESEVSDLPADRTYNWERMSKIYLKTLGGGARAVDAEELLWNIRGMA